MCFPEITDYMTKRLNLKMGGKKSGNNVYDIGVVGETIVVRFN